MDLGLHQRAYFIGSRSLKPINKQGTDHGISHITGLCLYTQTGEKKSDTTLVKVIFLPDQPTYYIHSCLQFVILLTRKILLEKENCISTEVLKQRIEVN
jgi:hypothetical protein